MTRSVSRGISSKARTISASRRPASLVVGHGGPHALVELAAELLDEALLVLGDLEVALGDQLLAMPRAHAQELHRGDYGRGPVPAGAPARRRAAAVRPKTSTGPGPAPISAQAVAHRVARRSPCAAARPPAA